MAKRVPIAMDVPAAVGNGDWLDVSKYEDGAVQVSAAGYTGTFDLDGSCDDGTDVTEIQAAIAGLSTYDIPNRYMLIRVRQDGAGTAPARVTYCGNRW